MKERAKALLSKNKNELPAAHTLYVSLDRADNVIEGGPPPETKNPTFKKQKMENPSVQKYFKPAPPTLVKYAPLAP